MDLQKLWKDVADAKRALAAALKRDEPVEDFELVEAAGPVRLSALFGGGEDLIVVHNMGKSCAYCTLWADGFVGLHTHLLSRASFVVCSPDDPATQQAFAASRGWPFRMVSDATHAFTTAMGFYRDGHPGPGFSAFRRGADGAIRRTGMNWFGPGDDFCAVWPMFEMLGDGGEWAPRFDYPPRRARQRRRETEGA